MRRHWGLDKLLGDPDSGPGLDGTGRPGQSPSTLSHQPPSRGSVAGLEATTPSWDHLTTSSGLLLTPGPDSSHPSGPPALSSAKLRSCVLRITCPRLKPLPRPSLCCLPCCVSGRQLEAPTSPSSEILTSLPSITAASDSSSPCRSPEFNCCP